MSTTHPSEEFYAEPQSAIPLQPKQVQASRRLITTMGAVAISIGAILAGLKIHDPSTSNNNDIGKKYYAERHAYIEAGNEDFIRDLGALDHPSFYGREEKIYSALATMLYADLPPTIKRKGGIQIVCATLKEHAVEVQWAWMQYTKKMKEFCDRENMKFENVPSSVQKDAMLRELDIAGLYGIAQSTLQENKVASTTTPLIP